MGAADKLVAVGGERAAAAGNPVVAAAAVDLVVAAAAQDHVGPISAVDRVVSRPAEEPIRPVAAADHQIDQRRPLLPIPRIDPPLAAVDQVFRIGVNLVVPRPRVDYKLLCLRCDKRCEILPGGGDLAAGVFGPAGDASAQAERIGSGIGQHRQPGAIEPGEDDLAGSVCGQRGGHQQPRIGPLQPGVEKRYQLGGREAGCFGLGDGDRDGAGAARDLQREGQIG